MDVSPLFSQDFTKYLVGLIDDLVSLSIPSVEDQEDAASDGNHIINTTNGARNLAWFVGTCLRTLSKRDPQEGGRTPDLEKWIREGIRRWSWSTEVVEGLVAVIHSQSKPPASGPGSTSAPQSKRSRYVHFHNLLHM